MTDIVLINYMRDELAATPTRMRRYMAGKLNGTIVLSALSALAA